MTRPSQRKGRAVSRGRPVIPLVVIIGAIVCLGWVAIRHGQLIKSFLPQFLPVAERHYLKEPPRGTIYDRNYKELAESLERVSVYALPREVGNISETATKLAPLLGLEKKEVMLKLNDDARRTWLVRDISQNMEEEIRALKLPGIFLKKELVRHYPRKESLAHLLGYADDNMGLAGVEYRYNKLLGHHGPQMDHQDPATAGKTQQPGINSSDLVLTVDLKIQKKLEKILTALTAEERNIRVGGCIMDMSSGALVASAGYPSFDPGRFSKYNKKNLENLLLQPVVIPKTIQRFFKDAALIDNQVKKTATLLPWSVVAEQINIGGQIRLWERLGLSSSLKLDFAVEEERGRRETGFLPVGTMPAFGAVPEVATPFQMLTGISRLINHGRKIVPYVLDKTIDRATEREFPYKQEGDTSEKDEISSLSRNRYSQEIKRLLLAKQEKSLPSVFLYGQQLARKSVAENDQYVQYKILFGFPPVDESDLIFMLVVEQSAHALVKRTDFDSVGLKKRLDAIVPSTVALYEVMKTNGDMLEVEEREEINFQMAQVERQGGKEELKVTRIRLDGSERRMPDLLGLGLRKSMRLLKDRNVKVTVDGFGRVVKQVPVAGTSLDGFQECLLVLRADHDSLIMKKTVGIN